MNALGIGLTVFFGLLSLVLSLLLFFRSRRRKCLKFTWKMTSLQTREHPEITILFKGKEIENLSRLRLLIWNSGNVEIRHTDIPSAGNPSVWLTGAKILSTVLLEASPDTKCTALQRSDKEVSIDFEFLNPDDYAVLDILCELAEPKSLSVHASAHTIGGLPAQSGEFAKPWEPKEIIAPVTSFTAFFLVAGYLWVRAFPHWIQGLPKAGTSHYVDGGLATLLVGFLGWASLGLLYEFFRQRKAYRLPDGVRGFFTR